MWGMWESNPLNKPNQLLDITNTRIGGKNRRTSTLIIYIISTLSRFLPGERTKHSYFLVKGTVSFD